MAEDLEKTNEEQETTNEVIEPANDELEKMQHELDETTDRLKRIMAEFENYKKRNAKEKDQLYGSILSDIVAVLLPVIDNLEKAVVAKTEDSGYQQGVEMVLKQFLDVLASLGVKKIETVGKTFDPEIHEAVSSVVDEKLGEKEIKEEYRTGYQIGPKVIRHAMVVVAN